MIRVLGLAALIAVSTLTITHAADPVTQEEAPVPVDPARFDWSGAYIGFQVGYNHFTDDFIDPQVPYFGSFDGSGHLAGVHAGYNYQAGQWVLGLEADISSIGGEGQSVVDNAPNVFGLAEANWEASVRGRIGYAYDSWLIYGTGGVGWANYDFDYTFPGPPPVFGQGDQFSETVHGYTVGGGVEWASGTGWTARVEYRYSDYDTASSSIIICCAPPPNSQDHDLTTHTVRFALSRKL